jgi:alpha-1,3-rhamnosyl/mannosyltransferase
MTIVVDADVLGRQRTGDETYVAGLLRELPAVAPDLLIAATARHAHLVPAGILPLPVRAPGGSQVFRIGAALPWALYRARATLAHFQYVVPPAWRGPCVVTVHDLSYEHHPEFFTRADHALLSRLVPAAVRRAARVFTVSEFTRGELIDRYQLPEAKVIVTPNGLDPSFGPDGPRRAGAPYLLFVGALQPRKDPACAVRAMRRLDPELHLVMAGPPKLAADEVHRAIAQLGLQERVHVLGRVSSAELAALYRGAACLVLPSRYEGFGLPALEAMASGTPVVAARSTALPEVIDGAGVLFPPGDDEALASAVQHALRDRSRLVTAGLARAARFRWSDVAARTAAAYREVLAR